MFRSLTLAALPLFSLALIPACTPEVDDELAGEASDDGLDGKADGAPDGAYTYFAIKGDTRRCAYPMCGGHHLDRLNAATTTCHDGSKQATCYTPVLDWSETGLSPAQQDELTGRASQGALSEGVTAIVRGRFAKQNTTTPRPELGRFIVTEAWLAEGEGVSDGVFAKVVQNGIRCIAAPCPSLTEKALNSSRRANIAELDFEVGGFTEASTTALVNDLIAPSGIIVAGNRFSFTYQGRAGKGRTATNAYRNLANDVPVTGGCFVGGCSSQLCSDQEGMISTCEWREEYACYQQATCERQSNGDCGWTQDAELQACLGTPTQQN